ncbi:MAG TPA: DUF2283 domain-containing protein [Terriglobia bacterium]|nr:DUF2283 domain-containing protein [Terriglobia bacterium]
MVQKDLELKVNYDPSSDVLYLSYGDPREAISEEIEDGEFLRLDPDTRQVVGVTVVDFSKRFSQHPGNTLSFRFPQAEPASAQGNTRSK